MSRGIEGSWRDRRGQVVLLAAATVAIALVPMLLAYLQLGYHADVAASADVESPVRDVVRELGYAVHAAEKSVAGDYAWRDRETARQALIGELAPQVRQLERARIADGIIVAIDRNESAGMARARQACPGGPNRIFGPCRANDGIVLQERAGGTHFVGIAFDVRVTGADGWTNVTVWTGAATGS